MEIAVFSDIHGNYHAFSKCIEYALQRNIGIFLFLGDYLGEFPYPQRTMELLYDMKERYTCFFIRGNKEDYWINRKKDSNCAWKDGNSSVGAMKHCYASLTQKDIAFFESLPVCLELILKDAALLLACHGSPRQNNEKMLPDRDAVRHILDECKYRYILCGHTHLQDVIEYDGKLVLNPGAVGVSLHSGGKAQFMILHRNAGNWEHEFISLDYDKENVIKEMKESGLEGAAPYWCRITRHLIDTGEVSHGTVLAKALKLCAEDGNKYGWYEIPEVYWEKAVRELKI